MRKKSDRQAKIDGARMHIKKKLKMYMEADFGVCCCASCGSIYRGDGSDPVPYDLDEIEGRHGENDILLPSLNPDNMQILCRGCHTRKTKNELGCYVDFRDNATKILMSKMTRAILRLLPEKLGQLKTRLDDQIYSIRKSLL